MPLYVYFARVFRRSFTAFSENRAQLLCNAPSLPRFSLFYLLLCVLCLDAKTPVPFFLGFLFKKKTKKKHLEQKKIACRARMALALCLPTLSPASSKGLRPDVRSRSLLSAGHSATLWAFFLCIQRLWRAGVQISHWDRVDSSSSSFFSLNQRLDLKNSLRLSHLLVGGGDGTLVCLP
jgi:hypothetical protein